MSTVVGGVCTRAPLRAPDTVKDSARPPRRLLRAMFISPCQCPACYTHTRTHRTAEHEREHAHTRVHTGGSWLPCMGWYCSSPRGNHEHHAPLFPPHDPKTHTREPVMAQHGPRDAHAPLFRDTFGEHQTPHNKGKYCREYVDDGIPRSMNPHLDTKPRHKRAVGSPWPRFGSLSKVLLHLEVHHFLQGPRGTRLVGRWNAKRRLC